MNKFGLVVLTGLNLIVLPSVFAHQVVRVSAPNAVDPAEVTIAINPVDPNNIVAASFQTFGNNVSSFNYYSKDAGKSWATVPVDNPEGFTQGDDQVTFGPDGTVFHSHLAFEGLFAKAPSLESAIPVSRSYDGGATWQNGVAAVEHVGSIAPFEDKPSLIVDSSKTSPYRGNIYISWTRFDVYGSADLTKRSNIAFSRSTDGGHTFSSPLLVSQQSGDCKDSSQTDEGAMPAVGPDGTVYLVWVGPSGLVLAKSTDGGVSFGANRVIGPLEGGWDFPIAGLDRANGLPVAGVDTSAGPNRGTLYVNWVDSRNGDPDVFVVSSRDGGQTWSPPVRVNDDRVGNGRAQFFTWMSVDPVDGSINLVFYDRRAGTGTQTGVTVARSVDGGKTFANFSVAIPPFATDESAFFGDYTGIAAYGGQVDAAFMHFLKPGALAISAALFHFVPGSLVEEN